MRQVAGVLPRLDREALLAAVEVGEAERNAVHHHAVERRLVAFGMHRLAQHTADRLVDRDRFAVEGRQRLLDGVGRFDVWAAC